MKKYLKEISKAFHFSHGDNINCRAALADLYAIGCWFSITGKGRVGYKLQLSALRALNEIHQVKISPKRNLSKDELKELAEAAFPHAEVKGLFEGDN